MVRRKNKARGNGEGSIFQRADGRWQGAVSLGHDANGKRIRRTISGKTETEVIKKVLELRQQIAAGLLHQEDATLSEYVFSWLKEKAREVKPQTVEDYQYQLKHYVLPKIGRVKLSKLKPMHVQRLVGELADEVSPQRANKCRRVLSTALRQAVRWELIPRNPCDAVKPLKVKKHSMTLWTADDVVRFLEVAQGHRLYAFFYLALSTGMRRGELLGLKWEDLDGSSLTIRRSLIEQRGRIMLSTPKTEKGYRRVSLATDVVMVLEEHRAAQRVEADTLGLSWPNTGFMFVSEVGTLLHPRNLERVWYDLQEKARRTYILAAHDEVEGAARRRQVDTGQVLPRIRLHDLRHLHASMLIRKGLDPRSVADRLGHTNPSFTLDVYSHFFEEKRDSSTISILEMLRGGEEAN